MKSRGSRIARSPVCVRTAVIHNRVGVARGEQGVIDWDAISAIAESIGAIATVGMLGYLAIQIRQSAKALKTSSLYQANAQISETMLTDSELQFGEDVSADQKEQLLNRLAQRFVLYEWFFYQFRDGNVDSEIWESRTYQIKFFLDTPLGRAFWSERRLHFADSFRGFVDGLETEASNRNL